MTNIVAIVVNSIIFAVAGAHFGGWVVLPLALAYFVGLFQALASAR